MKVGLGISGSGRGIWRIGEDASLVGSFVSLKLALSGIECVSDVVPIALVTSVVDFKPEDANCVSSSSPLLAPLDPLLPVFVLRFDERSSRWRCSLSRSCSSFSESEPCELLDIGGELSVRRSSIPRALSWPGRY